jgi:myo-inositol-1-phosphate synthase
MGGRNTLACAFLPLLSILSAVLIRPPRRCSIYNTCQDSLLATPLILDLAILAELMTRVTYRDQSAKSPDFEKLYSVLGLLSYMLKVRLAAHRRCCWR